MMSRDIQLELLPAERRALLRWTFTPEVREQLAAFASSDHIESITIPRDLVGWLESDLNHAIVKKGCRDETVIELSYRLEYVQETGDGRLSGW